jgi:hypothetical protein
MGIEEIAQIDARKQRARLLKGTASALNVHQGDYCNPGVPVI